MNSLTGRIVLGTSLVIALVGLVFAATQRGSAGLGAAALVLAVATIVVLAGSLIRLIAEPMIDAVRRARSAGIRTGLISNSWGDGLAYDPELLRELFDVVVISGEVGLHKPEPEIFRLAARRIGLVPQECVFVDDLRENCAGAEAVGMTAILHRGSERTLPELKRMLDI